MKHLFILTVLALSAQTLSATPLTLATDGRTDYTIVLPATATKTDRLAADELQLHLRRSTGAEFPIKVEPVTAVKRIELGTSRAREICLKAFPNVKRVEETSFAVRDGDTLAICGEGRTGNAYGVYLFLEKAVGCRWFTPSGVDRVPKHPTLALDDFAVTETPKLAYRTFVDGNHYRAGRTDSADILFYFRNRMNMNDGNYSQFAEKRLEGAILPRMKQNGPGSHTFFKVYLNPDKYFKDHPDWYTLDEHGKRVPWRHLCFSNPELRAALTKRVMETAAKYGGKGFLDISAWDTGGAMCHCEGCKAAQEKHKSNAGKFFEYLHELALVMKKAYPDIVLHTLAYHPDCTQPAPVGLPPFPDNVVIVFAPIDDDAFKSVLSESNASTLRDFKNWSKLARMWLWEYPILFNNQPFGYLGRICESVQAYERLGLEGSYIQQGHTDFEGGFAPMAVWCQLRLFRDSELDWRTLREEFCRGVYGAAADGVIAYEEELDRRREASKDVVTWWGRGDVLIKSEDIVAWQNDFDRMERSLGNDADAVQRLRQVRLDLDSLTLTKWRLVKQLDPKFTSDEVHTRATNTFARAIECRWNVPSVRQFMTGRLKGSKYRRAIDTAYEISKANLKPLPPEFSKYPKDKVVQVFPQSGYLDRVIRVDDPDAALGWAMKEMKMKPSFAKYPVKVAMWEKMKPETTSPKLSIDETNVVLNQYHLYHIGKCKLTSPSMLVWVETSWYLNCNCSECYRPGMDEEWDLWVSLKFEGPCFDPKSTAKESHVYLDRVVLVGPEPCK